MTSALVKRDGVLIRFSLLYDHEREIRANYMGIDD